MSFYLMHRGWRDHHLFKDQPYSDGEAWEYLIASANFVLGKYRQANKLYEIPRGDLATSFRSLGEKWKWSTNKVIRFLRLLENDAMISLKTEHNFLQITLANYETYQNPYQEKETERKQSRNTDGDRKKTETNTNVKKDKELKEEKEKSLEVDFPIDAPTPKKVSNRGTRLSEDWDLPSEWGEWAEKKGMTREAIIRECDKFKDYWIGKSGANATKSDWGATWRNWVRKHLEEYAK